MQSKGILLDPNTWFVKASKSMYVYITILYHW